MLQTRRTTRCLPALAALLLAVPLVLLVLMAPAQAQLDDLRVPISLDADSSEFDGKNSMWVLEGLRLSQGNIGVQADHGRASKLDFDDSVWQFSGNVVIDTGDGHIECDAADLRFDGHRLQLAVITGSPATFELRRPGSDEVTHAEAGRLEYDFPAGIIEFSDNATITEGGNQISSSYLVYNISEQRINARSGGNGDDKVKITYTPGVNDAEGEQPPDDDGDDTGDDGS